MARRQREDVVLDGAVSDRGEVRPLRQAVVEEIGLDQHEIGSAAAPGRAAARNRVALGIVVGHAVVGACGYGIRVDLEVRRGGVVGLVVAGDVPVAAVAQVDSVPVAAARVIAGAAFDHKPIGLPGEEGIFVLPVADAA